MLGEHLLGIYEKALDAEDDWYQRMEKARELLKNDNIKT